MHELKSSANPIYLQHTSYPFLYAGVLQPPIAYLLGSIPQDSWLKTWRSSILFHSHGIGAICNEVRCSVTIQLLTQSPLPTRTVPIPSSDAKSLPHLVLVYGSLFSPVLLSLCPLKAAHTWPCLFLFFCVDTDNLQEKVSTLCWHRRQDLAFCFSLLSHASWLPVPSINLVSAPCILGQPVSWFATITSVLTTLKTLGHSISLSMAVSSLENPSPSSPKWLWATGLPVFPIPLAPVTSSLRESYLLLEWALTNPRSWARSLVTSCIHQQRGFSPFLSDSCIVSLLQI